MPQVLTKLRIDEVSAVDRGAGDGTKIVLMKRDDSGSDDWYREQREISERVNKEHIAKHDRSFSAVLARMEMAKADAADGDEIDRRDDDGTEKRVDHHASTVADLLVESGRFPHRTAALDHLLNTTRGQALLQRLHKAEAHTGKESSMDKIETVRDVVKQHGITAVAKSIIDENRSYGISEQEFVELASESAQAEFPLLSKAQAFAKLYENPTIWRACNVLKAMPFVANVEPLVIGGEDTRDLSDTSKAIEQLKELGARRWPTASASAQFERALTAPENHALARRAVPIPQPTTSFPFSR